VRASIELALAGERLQLRSERAAFLPAHGTLLVADAHVGKALSFRRLGVPVPGGTTADLLRRLDALVEATGARRIVFLGDFLHSARAQTAATVAALARWRERHAALQLTLVRGNHDRRAGDPHASLAIDCVDEPLRLGALALCHHPRAVPGAYVLAGHWHPCASVGGRALDRLRLPCFWIGAEARHPVGVLPAFGGFTGMHPIARRAGDRVFVLTDDRVAEVPPRGGRGPAYTLAP
jgi:DNA ligase-associated metallophosphoesterase